MGDRANVVVEYEDKQRIYLYTHWGGSNLPTTLQLALKRSKDRWQDPSYLCRIIFSEMTKDFERKATGFGISPYPTDNEYPFLVVDVERQMVFVEDDNREHFGHKGSGSSWTFQEYADAVFTTDPR